MKRWVLLVILIVGGAISIGALAFFFRSTKSIKLASENSTSTAKSSEPSPKPTSTPATCPAGFILVPGNTQYGTQDFCVMKYDAKCAAVTDLTTGLAPAPGSACAGTKVTKPAGRPAGTYRNSGPGCACTGDRRVVSVASGAPLAYLPARDGTSTSAATYCAAQGWNLITNAEWMTIARNVEQVPANWCNRDGSVCGFAPGTPGKILANGHNDGTPNAALPASPDDSQGCFGTARDGSNLCGHSSSQKRTLQLTNGQVIWDLAGNVWSWVDGEVRRADQPQSATGARQGAGGGLTGGTLDNGWVWSEFAPPKPGDPIGGGTGVKTTVILENGTGPSLGYDAFRPSNPAWNSAQGVGRIYHYSSLVPLTKQNGAADQVNYAFIRGGTWQHGYDSGAFSVHLSPTADKTQINDVGFRCVTSPISSSF